MTDLICFALLGAAVVLAVWGVVVAFARPPIDD
jgi:hypothetical protein